MKKINTHSHKLFITGLILVSSLWFGPSAHAESRSLAIMVAFKSPSFVKLAQVSMQTSTIDEEPTYGLTVEDERIGRLNAYFAKYDMPLEGYGEQFVAAAQKCNIDWRLLPAIGVRESSGGKHQRNNNPFGWGSARIRFDDWNEAIDVVSDNLCGLNPATARYYKDKSTAQRLWYYNGTVLPSYPAEVMDIMDMM